MNEQPMPAPNEHRDIQSLVLEDIQKRRQHGIQTYGTALQPFNNRDAVRDAYEEALDLSIYLRQVMVERRYFRNVVNRALNALPIAAPVGLAADLVNLRDWLERGEA